MRIRLAIECRAEEFIAGKGRGTDGLRQLEQRIAIDGFPDCRDEHGVADSELVNGP